MTPAQCRAARAFIELTQPQLAAKASLGLSTVVDFELSRRGVSTEAIAAISSALEEAGVIFIAAGEDKSGGPGVRLKDGWSSTTIPLDRLNSSNDE